MNGNLNTAIKMQEKNTLFKRKKVPFESEIYRPQDIENINGYITQVRSFFAANHHPELPNYYKYSTNPNHTLISGKEFRTLRENFNY